MLPAFFIVADHGLGIEAFLPERPDSGAKLEKSERGGTICAEVSLIIFLVALYVFPNTLLVGGAFQVNTQRFINATKIALPALVLAFALPAFAIEVTFSTTGEFCAVEVAGSCPVGSPTSVTFASAPAGSITINAIGLPAASYDIGPPVFVNAIEFTSTTTNKGGTAPVGGFFTLTIDQTAPAGGPGIFAGALSGQIGFHNGSPEVSFAGPLQLDLGGVYYTLGSNTYGLPNPGGNGQTFIQMEVTPEPAFMMLTGLGFAGLAFVAYRRRRTV